MQTDAQGVATDSFQCDGVVGTATITALIALPLPNNIGPTMTATTQVECTEPVVPPGGGGLWLEKVDQDGNPVPGAGFSIVGGGVALDCTTDEQGECHFEGLSAGDYAIEETLIPNGYTFLSCKPNPVTVPRDGQVTVTCLNERSTVEVPDLSIEKRHVVLDKDVQDDTGEDYIELAVGQTVFLAGKKDAFNQSDGPEPTSPSPALLLALTQKCFFGPLQQFDVVPDNLCFGHTFSGLPAIGAATLEIHLRAHPTDSLTRTDALALQLSSDGTTFAWSIGLNALIEWATGGGVKRYGLPTLTSRSSWISPPCRSMRPATRPRAS